MVVVWGGGQVCVVCGRACGGSGQWISLCVGGLVCGWVDLDTFLFPLAFYLCEFAFDFVHSDYCFVLRFYGWVFLAGTNHALYVARS